MALTRRQTAIGISVFVHAILLTVLLFWVVPKYSAPQDSDTVASGDFNRQTADAGAAAPAPQIKPLPAAEASHDEIKKSLDQQLELAQRLPAEKKLSELEKNARRLQSIASNESIKQTAMVVAESFGVDTKQYDQVDKAVEGALDISTAQIANVTRRKAEGGGWEYTAELVDQAGHRSAVPLLASEGESLYDAFQMMEKYPMMKGVYRSVVMPVLQKLTATSESPPVDADSDIEVEP
ncbi:hypothetical protein LOC67_02245 [Stieleria sp. JC731]|uniref:hypothetical protein n=1 Tax=Pirellulaceae TaxID=2691357 RepID=UPI001E3A19B1|nr:hypothetical protein [Stieleria sp. JC731]MCC9599364.1 hypothetical protein [Stieleria sp. JC731]